MVTAKSCSLLIAIDNGCALKDASSRISRIESVSGVSRLSSIVKLGRINKRGV